MYREKYVDECRYFRTSKCKYVNDELMKKFIHRFFVEEKVDTNLYDEVNEFRCGCCKVFELKN
jgi:hypothetical protein